MRNCLSLLSVLSLWGFTTGASAQTAPKGFTIPEKTLSPDKHYGVTVPVLAEHIINDKFQDPDNSRNSLVDITDGHVLTTIDADTGWDRQNRGGVLPSRWSSDSTLLLWEVEGRFSPQALVLIKVVDNKVNWQVNLLTTVQQAILVRTHKAARAKYAAAMRWNKGNGSAFPDGFTVNVRAEGDKERGGPGENVKGKPITLPMLVHAELTSNPKEIESCPKDAQLDSELDGVIDQQGKLTVSRFRLRRKPFENATSSSWLELTNPTVAIHSPIEYGDVVSLQGRVIAKNDEAGKVMYFLTLKQKISVPATVDEPAENNVSEMRLLDFEKEGLSVPDVKTMGVCDVDGTLGHAHTTEGAVLTVKVHGYGYSSR